jgi:hypothetical protein
MKGVSEGERHGLLAVRRVEKKKGSSDRLKQHLKERRWE